MALFTRVFVDEGRSPNVVDALFGMEIMSTKA